MLTRTCRRLSQDLVSALEGPGPEGSPAASPAGESGAALPSAAPAAGPGPLEGAPPGLRQEEGEAVTTHQILTPPLPPPLPGRASQARRAPPEGRGPSCRTPSASRGAGWSQFLGHMVQEPPGMAGGTEVKGVSPGERRFNRETWLTGNHGLSELGHLRTLAMGEHSLGWGASPVAAPDGAGQGNWQHWKHLPCMHLLLAAAEAGRPAPGPDTQPVLLLPVATPGGSRAALPPELPDIGGQRQLPSTHDCIRPSRFRAVSVWLIKNIQKSA